MVNIKSDYVNNICEMAIDGGLGDIMMDVFTINKAAINWMTNVEEDAARDLASMIVEYLTDYLDGTLEEELTQESVSIDKKAMDALEKVFESYRNNGEV